MIYFIRHGESEANVKKVFAGQKENSPLTVKGEEQALEAAYAIKRQGIKIDRIIASPLKRARKTAQIIASCLDISDKDIQVDDRAMEYDMGDFTGTPLRKVTPEERSVPHNEEDPEKFQERVISLVKDAGELEGTTLIVSHAGVGRVIEATRIKMHAKDFYDIDPYPNAQLVEIKL